METKVISTNPFCMEGQEIGLTVSPFFITSKGKNTGDSSLEETLCLMFHATKQFGFCKAWTLVNNIKKNKPQIDFFINLWPMPISISTCYLI